MTDQNEPYPLPALPELINLEGYPVISYVHPQVMANFLLALSRTVSLKDFDAILVNLNGGRFLFDFLCQSQNLSPHDLPVAEIEYHRPANGYSADIVTPVPDWCKQTEKVLGIDDILDTGGVLSAIATEVPQAAFAIAVWKPDIPNQIRVPNPTRIAFRSVNRWLGGVGMNLGDPYPLDFPRLYAGLVIKPGS